MLRRATTIFVGLVGLLVLPALLFACTTPDAVGELGRVAPLEPGRPVLVFVYTDG